MLHKKQKAFPVTTKKALGFTLVELIVVVTILAILATIGFVSYSSYLTGVRDTNRLSQLVSISDGLELYRTKKDLPLPDDNIEIQVGTGTIAYQGYAGSNTLETIDFTKGGKDPKDDSYFTYYLTEDRKYFQLLGFLEEEENLSSQNQQPNIPSSYAVDYANRLPTVYGKKLGVLTNTQNTPLQELVSSGQINLTIENTSDYVAHLSDTSSLTGSTAGNSDLVYLENTGVGGGIASSCKTLIDRNSSLKGKDGIYVIDPEGNEPFPVYCDMTTDGGGWTFFGHMDSTSNGDNFFDEGIGTYLPTRLDDGTKYSLGTTQFDDTEMMVTVRRGSGSSPFTGTIEVQDPMVASAENKIVFYQYAAGSKTFNTGPIPCTAGTHSYKTQIGGSYISGGTVTCLPTRWYSFNEDAGTNYLTIFSDTGQGNYLGIGMTGTSNIGWSHDGWWYLR